MLLGVDAGGTKTRAVIAEYSGSEIAVRWTGSAGPGNVRSEGLQSATANILEAVQQAATASGFQESRGSLPAVDAACLSVAGAGRADEKAAVEAWALDAGLASRVRVVSDADVLLAAAEDGNAGGAKVCLIAGTGSLAIGQNAAGETARCGGWGYLIGDQGSGYAIGRSALEAVADAADGRGPATKLTESILRHLQLDHPQDLIAWCYAGDQQAALPRRRIASLAPVVFACHQDAAAQEIVRQAANDLAAQVATVCLRLELINPTVACTGSLLIHQPAFRDSVFKQLEALGIAGANCCVVAQPEVAALNIAKALLAD
ncbi:MAG: BadF/BadG/BcrA/BcrD ATPase family protein [Aureliella sp.]